MIISNVHEKTTSFLQSMDAGRITVVKRQNFLRQVPYAFSAIEESEKKCYIFDQLKATKQIKGTSIT